MTTKLKKPRANTMLGNLYKAWILRMPDARAEDEDDWHPTDTAAYEAAKQNAIFVELEDGSRHYFLRWQDMAAFLYENDIGSADNKINQIIFPHGEPGGYAIIFE